MSWPQWPQRYQQPLQQQRLFVLAHPSAHPLTARAVGGAPGVHHRAPQLGAAPGAGFSGSAVALAAVLVAALAALDRAVVPHGGAALGVALERKRLVVEKRCDVRVVP